MNKLPCFSTIKRMALGVCVVSLLSACGGGGSGSAGVDANQPLLDATVQEGTGPIALVEGAGSEDFAPTMNVDVAYADPTQDTNNEYIVEQWLHMQNCMQVSAVEPVVTVVDGKLTPLTTNDDVVRHIDGSIQASSNVTDTGATIQIRAADFDGSLGKRGSYLRSIMGRYLWLANGYAERDYPYSCTSGS